MRRTAFIRGYKEERRIALLDLVAELKACSSSRNLARGKLVHRAAIESGASSVVRVANTLVDMYGKCGSLVDARQVFEGMHARTTVSWTALILGYVGNGEDQVALKLFSRMRDEGCEADAMALVAALKACNGRLVGVQALHALACCDGFDSDVYVECTLVDMYSKCGSMEHARTVFSAVQTRPVVIWNALILGYAVHGKSDTASALFVQMQREGCPADARTFVATLRACADHERGRALHLLASSTGCDLNIFLQNTLVDTYGKLRRMPEAQRVFDNMQRRDVVSWTALALGYAENGEGVAVLDLFARMQEEGFAADSRAFVAALKGCSVLEMSDGNGNSLRPGKALHLLASSTGHDWSAYVRNSLIDMYGKCSSMEDARKVFEGMQHSVISWTALFMGYLDNGEASLVLTLFTRMRREGCVPDAVTFAAVLQACGTTGALDFGRGVHAEITRLGLQENLILSSCLIDFYARCGSLVDAENVFETNTPKDLVAWNALMSGYSRLGDNATVFALFERMLDCGLKPDAITFLCLLTACSHSGLFQKGRQYFEDMHSRYGLSPGVEHCSCMVDILGRASKLDDAMFFMRILPCSANAVAWMAVLSACRKWKYVELGRLAFEALMSLEDKNVGACALMASIYGNRRMWKDQTTVQALRLRLGVWKNPGQSLWTDPAGLVHAFLVGDKSHPQCQEIREKLRKLSVEMKKQGYVADVSSVTCNISDSQKEEALCSHSERLAIACALINTNAGEAVRIIKNLRVCDDCHAFTALISKLERRTIICRDVTRLHVFKDGECSCGNFW